jgi:hypothetical protein
VVARLVARNRVVKVVDEGDRTADRRLRPELCRVRWRED